METSPDARGAAGTVDYYSERSLGNDNGPEASLPSRGVSVRPVMPSATPPATPPRPTRRGQPARTADRYPEGLLSRITHHVPFPSPGGAGVITSIGEFLRYFGAVNRR